MQTIASPFPILDGPPTIEEDPLDVMEEIDRLKVEQDATILKLLLGGAAQQDAASRLGVNKSSVSRRMQSHGLAALLRSRQQLAPPA